MQRMRRLRQSLRARRHLDYMVATTETIAVRSLILSPGYEEFQAAARAEFGHGRYPNVLSSVQFERMLSASGPTEGKLVRPADGKPVRDSHSFNAWVHATRRAAPAFAVDLLMSATKEAMVALEHASGLDISIFAWMRAFGKEFDSYVLRQHEHGVKYIPDALAARRDARHSQPAYPFFLEVTARKAAKNMIVVLSVGMRPSQWVKQTASRLGLELNQFGFCRPT